MKAIFIYPHEGPRVVDMKERPPHVCTCERADLLDAYDNGSMLVQVDWTLHHVETPFCSLAVYVTADRWTPYAGPRVR